jgi:hypothetical protein
MSSDQLVESRFEGAYIEYAFEADSGGYRIKRVAGLHLVEEPESLLRERQGKVCRAIYRLDRKRCEIVLILQSGIYEGCKLVQGSRFKELAQRHVNAKSLTNSRHHLRHQQRMSAQLEKIIKLAHAIQAQHFAPNACHDLSNRRLLGGLVVCLLLVAIGLRQGAPIDLATQRSRQLIE